ncbi:hypothetical protein ABII15_11295 [Streptomyces sp. HUAS MG91]|uniref:Uncharacterized protein n=1 Tax=Streptomyces tabacisoli TaxID=3156398 RepID=A0AAU8IQK1_9ACTN
MFPLAVAVGLVLRGAHRLRGAGGATAWALARSACAPDTGPKRYEVRPEAVREMRPLPQASRRFLGTAKLPADLPVEPVGTLELPCRSDDSPTGPRCEPSRPTVSR